jgi:general secretion pathway protein G
MKRTKQAFTLIELLVVIAIIGILATVAVVSLNNARSKARDTKRVADAKQIQTALQSFFIDKGRYPTAIEWNSGSIYSTSTFGTTTYMTVVPNAPSQADGGCDSRYNQFIYSAADNGKAYNLSFCLGNNSGSLSDGGACLNALGLSSDFCPCDENTLCGLHCFYGDQIYNTVAIGNQCWFQNNLNIGTMISSKLIDNATPQNQANNGLIEKYCYDYVRDGDTGQQAIGIANCDIYGGLYQWNEAMQYSVVEGTRGICPTGWHVPSYADQETMISYLTANGYSGIEGTALKAISPSWNGTDNFSFRGLPSGFRSSNGSFGYLITNAYLWSSTVNAPNALSRGLSNLSTVGPGSGSQLNGFAVRCLKD